MNGGVVEMIVIGGAGRGVGAVVEVGIVGCVLIVLYS